MAVGMVEAERGPEVRKPRAQWRREGKPWGQGSLPNEQDG